MRAPFRLEELLRHAIRFTWDVGVNRGTSAQVDHTMTAQLTLLNYGVSTRPPGWRAKRCGS